MRVLSSGILSQKMSGCSREAGACFALVNVLRTVTGLSCP